MIPDKCRCGGALEYYGTHDGLEWWRCMSAGCGESYPRYHDVAGGC